jgi:triphosphatase
MPPVFLEPDLTAGEAFQLVIDACLGHLAANRLLLAEPGIEAVHQMRAAVRRLRSACKLFEEAVGHSRKAAALQGELRWLGRSLGRVRDWDVLLTETLSAMGADDKAIRAAAQRRRAQDRAKLERDLAGRRFFALERELESLAEQVAGDRAAGTRLAKAAPAMLSRLDRRVRKSGRGLLKLSEEERHDLRKKLKKLQYGVSFLASLFPSPEIRRFRKRTSRMGDLLGDLNDRATAVRLLRDLGHEKPLRAMPENELAKELRRKWRGYRKAERAWN